MSCAGTEYQRGLSGGRADSGDFRAHHYERHFRVLANLTMPVAATNSETAMQQVLDNLGSLPNATGAAELDLIFLRGIMESPIVRSLAKAHERLEETKLEAVRDNNLELVQEILRDLAQLAEQSSTAAELARILQEPHFQSLLETHDSVASKTYETPPPSPGLDPTFSNQPVPPDAVRMVGIRKTAGEHLVRVPGSARGGVWRGD